MTHDRSTDEDLLSELLALERGALTRWLAGDPSGFLELCAEEVSYLDPLLERRLDGLPALTAYYEALRGKIHADRFDILDPRVHCGGDLAVLTFAFASFGGKDVPIRWHCTEAYRRGQSGWKIVHTHWSFAKT